MVHSSEKLEGAASLLEMLEGKADIQRITASELAAVRCIVEARTANLDGVLEEAYKTRASPSRTGPCKTLRFFYVRLYS